MIPNVSALLLASLIPLVTYFTYYHPLLAGRFVQASDNTSRTTGRAILRIFLLLLFGFMLTASMMSIVIHQTGVYAMLQGQPQAEIDRFTTELMATHGRNFRTFKHGALHGTMTAIFLALPILGISATAGRKRAKVVLIHAGYWILTLLLMGGVVCAYA